MRHALTEGDVAAYDRDGVICLRGAFDVGSRRRCVGEEVGLTLRRLGPQGRAMPAPMLLARMIQALAIQPGEKALDVGTGYGYGAAILSRVGAQVTALESDPDLAAGARTRLAGVDGIAIVEAPLETGDAKSGPYDAILVNGRIETRPQALLEQLKDGGRLVCVMGRDRAAKATLFVRAGDAFGARPLFDAALPALGAFAAEAGFAF